MPDMNPIEEPLQFGEGNRVFGILSSPSASARRLHTPPLFVFLTAGLLHRVGPHRLHVQLARELAKLGLASLRVDLSGVGESPARARLTNRESVAADFAEIRRLVDARFGRVPLVLAGLCSGADNATVLAITQPTVVGLMLLDPICFPDRGFRRRALIAKYTHPGSYVAGLKARLKSVKRLPRSADNTELARDPLALRDPPSLAEMRAAFEAIRDRGGRALSVFTGTAADYNQVGQLGRVLGVQRYSEFSTELFWRRSDHTFTLEMHRRELIDAIRTWAGEFMAAECATAGLFTRTIASALTA